MAKGLLGNFHFTLLPSSPLALLPHKKGWIREHENSNTSFFAAILRFYLVYIKLYVGADVDNKLE